MSPVPARRLSIRGRVQGVGFRDAMVAQARHLGITGWVRNRRDGSVEAAVSGTEAQLAAIIAWSQQGPPAARVLRVEVAEEEGEFPSFSRFPTA
ncbi:MAG: acylphosphatase [Betaproteobacteria bacterium]|nr:acylphosphatase [Rhodocyclaceae bacterium]MCA3135481.1 acylphosphatase [Rhodocyclaceae bacterium]MCA3142900.1 acylphosphatase [Rhodocyclaceae bacterium]MCA3144940.1 acylphosphatase [Rhodocyclaceae bacterium]